MDAATAHNFRDKAQMKSVLRAAGVPCARYRLAESAAAAASFADEVGYPLVVKPPAGAGAKSTFRLDDSGDLKVWLDVAPPAPDSPALLEEFLTGEEGSYDSVMTDGQVIWDSVSRYLPTPLEVLRNPWIQWAVLMPRDIGGPEYEAIRAIAPTALRALGLPPGRPDQLDALLRARLRPVRRLGTAHGVRDLHARRARLVGGHGVPARPGHRPHHQSARPRPPAATAARPGHRIPPPAGWTGVLGQL